MQILRRSFFWLNMNHSVNNQQNCFNKFPLLDQHSHPDWFVAGLTTKIKMWAEKLFLNSSTQSCYLNTVWLHLFFSNSVFIVLQKWIWWFTSCCDINCPEIHQILLIKCKIKVCKKHVWRLILWQRLFGAFFQMNDTKLPITFDAFLYETYSV